MDTSKNRRTTLTYRVVTATIKSLARILCRVDDAQMAKVPDRGPLIMVANHINFLEAPLLFTHMQPRPMTGFAKAEAWKNPLFGFVGNLWGAIPIHRGETDLVAFRKALAALEEGYILPLAPEGTRSGDGRLQRGRPGAVFLALRSGLPILPMVYYGGEKFWHNIVRLRRTDFRIVVGQLFHLDPGKDKVTHQVRRQMTDEIMYQLAALLPPAYRGVYSDLTAATEKYLRFPPGAESNLRRA